MTSSRFTLLLIVCFSAISLSAQDTLATDLQEVTVQAYRSGSSAKRVAAAVATLDQQAIANFPGNDLLPAMNTIAGVRFEQRAPGSYRVSVRGSTLRSPFGVRNLKVYWNGIPFTEPGGDTQLNFLDAGNVDRTEVIKGPAGSLYGASTAGTLLLSTDTLSNRVSTEINGGSYGFFRALAQVQGGKGNRTHQLRYAAQRTDGYRDHSGLFRQTVELAQHFMAGKNRKLRLSALYTDLSYDLPGGLNAE
ncbi:TonB-dependent receptor plug domain-containing protein [Lewinella sp. 4G2]|uniref:TonB-dependent receptor plug domain-containing protein n=1 Tax=Lewinella sp. 4G2 TaxID=1803372 RepID=UPI0007B4C2CD|nr:TonB-dependent receptor plug domain-containing protein [Lewinella sp. 4G2]OAV44006.1 hypothetical protein A3850_005630 [Lewinella sp. 4G2]